MSNENTDFLNDTLIEKTDPDFIFQSAKNWYTDFISKIDEAKIFLAILIGFVLVLTSIALYFFYLYFRTPRQRNQQIRPPPNRGYKFRKENSKEKSTNSLEDFSEGSVSKSNSIILSTPPLPATIQKEPNLQPAANDTLSIHDEYRSIIASKLKPPPSTLDRLKSRESSGDVEIKQERDNEDVFSVISTRSLEKFKSTKSKIDRTKSKRSSFDSESTDSEQQDKIIVLKSGTSGTSKSKINKSSPKLKTKNKSSSSSSSSEQSKK